MVLVAAGILTLLTGCLYRMPQEDDVDLRPTTNNPNVIKERETNLIPGVSY